MQIKTVMNHNTKIEMRTFLDSLQELLVEFLFGKRVGDRRDVQNSGLFLVIGSCRLLDLLFLLFLAHVYNVLKGLLNRIAAGSSRKKKSVWDFTFDKPPGPRKNCTLEFDQ